MILTHCSHDFNEFLRRHLRCACAAASPAEGGIAARLCNSTCHGPFLVRGVSVRRKVTCGLSPAEGGIAVRLCKSTCHGPFLEQGVSVGRKVTYLPVACRGRHRRAPCALAICRRRRIRRWPGLWRRASCQPVACRERHRRVPVQRHKPRASVERGVSVGRRLQVTCRGGRWGQRVRRRPPCTPT